MADPQIPIPENSHTVETIGQLQNWNEDKIRRHFRGQVDSMIADLIEKLKAGVFGRLSDVFRGVSPPGMGDFFDQIWTGLSGNLSDALADTPGLESRLVPIRDAARGLIAPVVARVDAVEESQLSAEEQLALLEGVRGYGAAYQRWNENLRSAPGNRRRISLAPHGVAKGVRVEGGGIFIDEPGVWTVHAQVFARGTSFTPGLGSDDITKLFVILREYQPVYKTSTIKEVYGTGGKGPHHIQASFTVVIENAPALLDFEVFSDRWRYFDGGTALTSFSVVKTDSRIENPGEVTVPDA